MLYDTLSRKKKPFQPAGRGPVRIYTCGPSVYAYSHIGNFRTYLFEDVLVRYLRYKGFAVKRVMNITDIEDKAIDEAKREGKSLQALQEDKIKAFFSDADALGMMRPDVIAKASEHVPQMANLVGRICSRGYCRRERDGIYFDVRKFRRYGELSRLRNKKYLGPARRDDYALEGLWDFRLWKFWTRSDGDASWDSPFGRGRPGWHIECSAMAMHHLGPSIDIHCGGTDNIFPHHENEIAQSESATRKTFARFWLHARHLTVGKKKMSKRAGNVFYVRQILREGVHPDCLRFYLLSERYRRPLDFTWKRFQAKVATCERTTRIIEGLRKVRTRGGGALGARIAENLLEGFESAMDDDLDTRRAFRGIFAAFEEAGDLLKARLLRRGDATKILAAMERINRVFNVL
ncbi:MAG: cysteine--tRNA ligase [Candidatus Micrarchaeota archaeon]